MVIKKRELLFSVIIVCVLLCLGLFISGKISYGAAQTAEKYATAHTSVLTLTIRARISEMASETFKLLTIPSFFDTCIANIKRPTQLLIIEATRQSFHIACNIHAPSAALASINTIVVNIVSQIQNGWNRT
jgi:hypothetical protein